ncbi:DUF4222 domain-containing protein [Citrobacter freundii]|uniref:DUF4222 domain-containing protein n=1 Tax=Citrobacter freundii TaxID=546 RepID=UPI003878F735
MSLPVWPWRSKAHQSHSWISPLSQKSSWFSRSELRCDMSHANTSPDPIKALDINYRDQRGVIVHVTGWNREKQQVYFTRQNYPHECMQPVWKFQQYFTRCDE